MTGLTDKLRAGPACKGACSLGRELEVRAGPPSHSASNYSLRGPDCRSARTVLAFEPTII